MNNYEIINVLAPLLDFTKIDDIESNIQKIFDKIPNSNDIKNMKDYINMEDYGNKSKKINLDGLSNYKYIESCCWLFNEIENMIKVMIHQNEKSAINNYMIFNDDKYENHISILAMTTNPDVNTSIRCLQKNFIEAGYCLPFIFIKNIMKKKGYNIEVYSNKTDPKKVNDKRFHNNESYEKPVEIFELKLTYEVLQMAGRRRERSDI